MTATLRQIVTAAQGVVGEVSGSGTQSYGEDAMMQEAIRGFGLLFKKYYWDQYFEWKTVTLDGVTGIIDSDVPLASVLDFEDIRSVHIGGDPNPLGVLPKSTNPNSFNTGATPLCWTSLPVTHGNFAARKIRIYPIASEGDLDVAARIHPFPAGDWEWNSYVYLDMDMMVYATAFMTLIGDGLNPDAATVVQQLMETKFQSITNALAGRPAAMQATSSSYLRNWTAM